MHHYETGELNTEVPVCSQVLAEKHYSQPGNPGFPFFLHGLFPQQTNNQFIVFKRFGYDILLPTNDY